MYTDDSWSAPRSGFAWLGAFLFTPFLVLVASLACRAAARQDAEMYQGIAASFAVVAGIFTISLVEATAIALGLREGCLRTAGLTFVGGGWAYSAVMALGHWHLSRVFRAAENRSAEPPVDVPVREEEGR
jgi:hypothetical protein